MNATCSTCDLSTSTAKLFFVHQLLFAGH